MGSSTETTGGVFNGFLYSHTHRRRIRQTRSAFEWGAFFRKLSVLKRATVSLYHTYRPLQAVSAVTAGQIQFPLNGFMLYVLLYFYNTCTALFIIYYASAQLKIYEYLIIINYKGVDLRSRSLIHAPPITTVPYCRL
jgi:hypothetical protein